MRRVVGYTLTASLAFSAGLAVGRWFATSDRWGDVLAVLEAEHVVRAKARKIGVSR